VTGRLALAVATGLVLAPTSSAKEVGEARPPVALSVSPAHVALAAPGSRAIRLRNLGTRQVVVDAVRRALGTRAPATRWVKIVPARVVLRPGASAAFALRVVPRPRAAPGDHHVLVLLVARPVAAASVTVRMRLGVVVRMRVPGRIVRSLELRGLRVLRHRSDRTLLASVANRGNVSEELRGRITIVLVRGGHVVARLRAAGRRDLRPGMRAVFRARYAGRVRGVVRARVAVRIAGARRPLQREYSIRL
jgi:hypothetical protein